MVQGGNLSTSGAETLPALPPLQQMPGGSHPESPRGPTPGSAPLTPLTPGAGGATTPLQSPRAAGPSQFPPFPASLTQKTQVCSINTLLIRMDPTPGSAPLTPLTPGAVGATNPLKSPCAAGPSQFPPFPASLTQKTQVCSINTLLIRMDPTPGSAPLTPLTPGTGGATTPLQSPRAAGPSQFPPFPASLTQKTQVCLLISLDFNAGKVKLTLKVGVCFLNNHPIYNMMLLNLQ